MARRPDSDPRVTRDRLLRSALDLFAERGVDDVSIREVAKRAGFTLATVHHHFGTKQALYGACVDEMYRELEALRLDALPRFAEARTAPEIFEEVVRAAFRFACAHRGALKLLMRTVIDAGKLDEGRRQSIHLPFLDQGSQLFETALGIERNEARLLIQSTIHLIVRYALTAPDELLALAGLNPKRSSAAKAERAVEEHIVTAAKRMFRIEGSIEQ